MRSCSLGLMVGVVLLSAAPSIGVSTHRIDRKSSGILIASGSVEQAGLKGEWTSKVDLGNGRFDSVADLGAYRVAEIYDGRTRWRVEPSGGSHPLDSDFARSTAQTEAWLARFGWLQAGSEQVSYTSAEERSEGGKDFVVRIATPVGGTPVTLWFDKVSGNLAKTERRAWYSMVIIRYGDYRTVGHLSLPFSINTSTADGEQKITIARYAIDETNSQQAFGPPPPTADASVPRGGTIVAAPKFPQLMVKASVNGGTPMDFVFDTGGHSILTPEAAKALGLQAVGDSRTGGSGAGTITQRDTSVKTLRIGDAVLRDQHFYVLSLGYASMEQGPKPLLAGLLGLEILERFIVRVDYRAETLTLLPRETDVTCRGRWEGIRFTDDMPTVQGALDGIPAPFTIDTGNNGTLQLYDYWAKQHGLADRYRRGVETVSYGAGGASRNWVSYGRSVRLGGITLDQPVIRTTDDKGGVALSITEAGNLGTALLANYELTFDYGRSRICFEYKPGYVPVPFNRAGMRAIKVDPGAFAISLVNDGSPAAVAGLEKDDRITAVNGRPAHTMSGGDLTLLMTQPPGTQVTLEFERAGQPGHAVVTLREMLK